MRSGPRRSAPGSSVEVEARVEVSASGTAVVDEHRAHPLHEVVAPERADVPEQRPHMGLPWASRRAAGCSRGRGCRGRAARRRAGPRPRPGRGRRRSCPGRRATSGPPRGATPGCSRRARNRATNSSTADAASRCSGERQGELAARPLGGVASFGGGTVGEARHHAVLVDRQPRAARLLVASAQDARARIAQDGHGRARGGRAVRRGWRRSRAVPRDRGATPPRAGTSRSG